MSRDGVAAWTLLVINIILVAGFFIYIDKQDSHIARLEAERDSLDKDLFQARSENRHWREFIQRKDEWDTRHFRLYHREKQWPPDTLKTGPMKKTYKTISIKNYPLGGIPPNAAPYLYRSSIEAADSCFFFKGEYREITRREIR